MATTVQALIGAVYLDAGEDTVTELLATLGLDHEYLRSVTFNILPTPILEQSLTLFSANVILGP